MRCTTCSGKQQHEMEPTSGEGAKEGRRVTHYLCTSRPLHNPHNHPGRRKGDDQWYIYVFLHAVLYCCITYKGLPPSIWHLRVLESAVLTFLNMSMRSTRTVALLGGSPRHSSPAQPQAEPHNVSSSSPSTNTVRVRACRTGELRSQHATLHIAMHSCACVDSNRPGKNYTPAGTGAGTVCSAPP